MEVNMAAPRLDLEPQSANYIVSYLCSCLRIDRRGRVVIPPGNSASEDDYSVSSAVDGYGHLALIFAVFERVLAPH